MDYLLRIFNESIAGIIYFTAICFWYLKYKKIYNIRHTRLYKHKEMILYYAIPIVFISRILGAIAQNLMSHGIMYFRGEEVLNVPNTLRPPNFVPQDVVDNKNNTYSTLVFYRHLLLATSFLCISLVIWFRDKRDKRMAVEVTVIILLLLAIGYFYIQHDLNAINEYINDLIRKSK